MKIKGLNKKSDKVYIWLLEYIDGHKFSGSTKLPSENAVSRRLSVSRDTVRVAFSRLAEEGLVCKIKGSGTYINNDAVLTSEYGGNGGDIKIGLILQGQDGNANSSLLEGIRDTLPSEQMDLRVFLTDNKFSNERRCLQTVMHQKFSGFIVDGVKASLMSPNLDYYRQIYKRRIPVIFYNNYYKELNYPKVMCDDRKCAQYLIDRLVNAGHREIAGIFNYDNYQSVEKFQGMVEAMKKHGIELQDDYIKWCVSNEAHDEHFVNGIRKFLKKNSGITAIVCCNYMIYKFTKKAVLKQNRKIPDDYSVVCFDYSDSDWKKEDVTCSVHQGYQIGQEVAGRLLDMIERKDWDKKDYTCILAPKIHCGRSIKDMV